MPDGLRLAVVLALIASMIVRNWIEALVADWQGESGPRLYGQTALDPRAHVDWLGTILLPLLLVLTGSPVLFASPKPLHMLYLGVASPYRVLFFVRMSGLVFHFVLAALLMLFLRPVLEALAPGNPTRDKLASFLFISALSQLAIGYILLLPIPPLPGGLLLGWLLPQHWREHFIYNPKLQYLGVFVVLVVLVLPPTGKLIFSAVFKTALLYVHLLQIPALQLLAILLR